MARVVRWERLGELQKIAVWLRVRQEGRVSRHRCSKLGPAAAQTKGDNARTVLLNAQVQREFAMYGRAKETTTGGGPLFASKASTAFSPQQLGLGFRPHLRGHWHQSGHLTCSKMILSHQGAILAPSGWH